MTIKKIIQDLHNQIATASGDSAKAVSPYFRYGAQGFDSNEGTPPQVRWMPTSFEVTRTDDQFDDSGDGSIYSIAKVDCTVRGRIWGETEEDVFSELRWLLIGVKKMMGTDNSQSMSQPGFVNISGDWLQETDQSIFGTAIEFDWTVRVNLAAESRTLQPILSASVDISGSISGSTSGSLEHVTTQTYLSGSDFL